MNQTLALEQLEEIIPGARERPHRCHSTVEVVVGDNGVFGVSHDNDELGLASIQSFFEDTCW